MEDIMRRYSIVALVVVLLAIMVFAGCGDPVLYEVSVLNDSSKTVSYRYNDNSDTLAPTDSKIYHVKAYTQKPSDISVVPPGTITITMDRRNETYIFEDITPFDLSVANTMPFPVTIKADNYIDADGTGKTELLIPEKAEETGAKIYTARPNFTITGDYPVYSVKVEWNIGNNIMYVTIK
jgi:hypothetical protein